MEQLRGHMAKRTILCRKCVKLCEQGEALLLVVKVVLVVFLTYPYDIEDIEWTKLTWS